MYVEIDLVRPGAGAALREPDDLGSLKVVVHGPPERREGLAAAVADVGRVDPSGDVFLAVEALKRLAGERVATAEWLQRFDRMVAYAASRGWVDADGTALRAHCEWRDVDGSRAGPAR
jgi:hypothetical protein